MLGCNGFVVHRRQILLVLLSLATSAVMDSVSAVLLSCTSTDDCRQRHQLPEGSECSPEGYCTNPYHHGGCLVPETRKTRVCHSEDSDGEGTCHIPHVQYPEVRLWAQNWESAIFVTWVLQIVLSEIAHVPATLEIGKADVYMDFYHKYADFGYASGSVDWEGIQRASQHGNCVQFFQQQRRQQLGNGKEEESHQSCMDVIPEVWNGFFGSVEALREDGHAEPLQGMGALGVEGFYIPAFTYQHDPTLVSYLGMQGSHNRRKMAETFLRPTTWGQYCSEVATCQTPNKVAQRAPRGMDEENSYFVEGLYTGHFRRTEQNDCDKWPLNCTGHIADFPCDWTSHVEAQCYHLGIPLRSDGPQGRSGGYSSSQLVQIWEAANATKSHVMMIYWTPSVLSERFINTPFEMIKVTLPPPTLECVNHRVGGLGRCDHAAVADDEESLLGIYGDPRGACDEEPHILAMAVGTSVRRGSQSTDIHPAFRSPAFDIVQGFRVSEYQMGQMLNTYIAGRSGEIGFDGRQAVCDWVRTNYDNLQQLLPPTYPRTIQEKDRTTEDVIFDDVVVVVACIAVVATLGGAAVSRILWSRARIQQEQRSFVILTLWGSFLVSMGALLLSLRTLSDTICIAVEYLTQLGFVLVLVPLAVELQLSSRLAAISDNSSRAGAERQTFFGVILILAFLVTRTAVDPPRQASTFDLEKNDNNTIIYENYYCASDGNAWSIVGLLWQLLLLLVTSVMAVQSGSMKHNREGRMLALLAYSHFLLAALRMFTFFVQDLLGESRAVGFRSLLFGVDVIACLAIYLVPKSFGRQAQQPPSTFASSIAQFRVASRTSSRAYPVGSHFDAENHSFRHGHRASHTGGAGHFDGEHRNFHLEPSHSQVSGIRHAEEKRKKSLGCGTSAERNSSNMTDMDTHSVSGATSTLLSSQATQGPHENADREVSPNVSTDRAESESQNYRNELDNSNLHLLDASNPTSDESSSDKMLPKIVEESSIFMDEEIAGHAAQTSNDDEQTKGLV